MKAHTEKYCHLQLERLDDRITPSNVAPQANFGNVISALNNVAVQVDRLNALSNIGELRVVNVRDVLNGNNVQALNNALNRNDVSILDQALQNANILNDNVIAVNVLSGGQVVLFTLPPV